MLLRLIFSFLLSCVCVSTSSPMIQSTSICL
nr:MAG TPA: hypothetical protein [Caudoviricetes sp.]